MTVNELIRKLREYDGNLPVVAPGFDESNLEDIEIVQPIHIEFHYELDKFHGGRHRESAEQGVSALFMDWN